MLDMVPFILNQEKLQVKREIELRYISVIRFLTCLKQLKHFRELPDRHTPHVGYGAFHFESREATSKARDRVKVYLRNQVSHLLEIVQDPEKMQLLQTELAAVVYSGEPFVKATYRLEGDGPFIFHTYEEIVTVITTVQSAYYPNVTAVTQ